MRTKLTIGMSLAALMLTAALSTPAQASEWDHRTVFNISAPVEIPGRVLAAGTYVFKTVGDQMNIVQILNKNEDRVVATMFAIPEEAAKTSTTSMLTLSETKKGTPEEIRAWFYPGDNIGWEFLYPHAGPYKQARIQHGTTPSL